MSSTPVKERSRDRSHWWLALLLLAQLVLMSFTAKRPGNGQAIGSNWVMAIFTPIAKVGDAVLSKVSGGVTGIGEMRRAASENVSLKEQVEQLTAQLNETREKAAQYDALRAQLGLPSSTPYQHIAANVISRDTSLWFKRLTIDRGTLDGVKKNMPIVTATGIVGRVVNVGVNFAQVQLITDNSAGVGVMLQSSRLSGELKGLNNNRCEIKYVPANEEVNEGEVVVTTGLDRIYPKGLVVGFTEKVENDPSAPWKRIAVKPAAQVDRVENVFVLLVEPKDIAIETNIKQ
jgi:rod shape-determining protein MreC